MAHPFDHARSIFGRTSAIGLGVTIVVGVVETVVVTVAYPDLGIVTGAGVAAMASNLLSTLILPVGAAVLAAAVLGLGIGRFAGPRTTDWISVGLVVAGLVVLAGLTVDTALFPVVGQARQGPARYVIPAVYAGAVVAGVLGALAFRVVSRFLRPVAVRWGTIAFWGLLAVSLFLPFSLAPVVSASMGPQNARLRRAGEEAPFVGAPVFIISVDTLRADHMSLYGYGRNTTPRIDAWARTATVFSDAATPRTQTAPALAALNTGLHPDSHGVIRNGFRLGESLVTLAERFREMGYETAGFLANSFLAGPDMGFDQGFDHFEGLGSPTSTAETGVEAVLPWLRGRSRQRPFFAWMHVTDPHTPYTPPEGLIDRFWGDGMSHDLDDVKVRIVDHSTGGLGEILLDGVLGRGWEEAGIDEATAADPDYLVARYDAEIANTDHWVGELLERIDREYPEAIVLLTADHGESMTEHGLLFYHGRFCYEPTCHIPFVVKLPGLTGARVDRLVSLVDVFPTLSDLVGVGLPPLLEGTSFADVFHPDFRQALAPGNAEAVTIEARSSVLYRLRGIRTNRWKLILTPRRWALPLDQALEMQLSLRGGRALVSPYLFRQYDVELYDRREDPKELRNVADRHPEVVRALRLDLLQRVQIQFLDHIALGGIWGEGDRTEDNMEELRALGYIR